MVIIAGFLVDSRHCCAVATEVFLDNRQHLWFQKRHCSIFQVPKAPFCSALLKICNSSIFDWSCVTEKNGSYSTENIISILNKTPDSLSSKQTHIQNVHITHLLDSGGRCGEGLSWRAPPKEPHYPSLMPPPWLQQEAPPGRHPTPHPDRPPTPGLTNRSYTEIYYFLKLMCSFWSLIEKNIWITYSTLLHLKWCWTDTNEVNTT